MNSKCFHFQGGIIFSFVSTDKVQYTNGTAYFYIKNHTNEEIIKTVIINKSSESDFLKKLKEFNEYKRNK